jgi:2-methylcitrate dehydratase PrpD
MAYMTLTVLNWFMSKVHVYSDADLSALYPVKWAARLEISTTLGIKKMRMTESPGDPGMPLTEEQLICKHHGFLDPFLGNEHVNEVIQMSADAVRDKEALIKLIGWIQNMKKHNR